MTVGSVLSMANRPVRMGEHNGVDSWSGALEQNFDVHVLKFVSA